MSSIVDIIRLAILIGDYKEEKIIYDLIKVVVINLGGETPEEVENNLNRLVRMLNVVFKSQKPADEILAELEKDYDLPITSSIWDEVSEMSFVGDAPYIQGKDEGMEAGMEIGYNKGLLEGKDQEKLDTAKRMIKDGILPLDKIAEYTGLSIDSVKELIG